jgi:hypothetical protein
LAWGFGGFGGGRDCGGMKRGVGCKLVDVLWNVVDDMPGFYAADVVVDSRSHWAACRG